MRLARQPAPPASDSAGSLGIWDPLHVSTQRGKLASAVAVRSRLAKACRSRAQEQQRARYGAVPRDSVAALLVCAGPGRGVPGQGGTAWLS